MILCKDMMRIKREIERGGVSLIRGRDVGRAD